jgi:sulfite exporter TauE/SafE
MIDLSSLWGLLASMFAIGLFGSIHCVGMCGGIAAALTHVIPAERRVGSSLLLAHLCFTVGRIGSYALAGAIAGSAGLVLGRLLGPAGPFVLRGAAGLLLVALGGWLPCGLVYSALAASMSQGQGRYGALAMLAFGLGTLPALVATGTLAGQLPQLVRRPLTRKTAGLLIIVFGIWTIGSAALTLRSAGCHEGTTHGGTPHAERIGD